MICNVVINKRNDTKEHIIPASIGGRKTVTSFICKKCNNTSGEKWDSTLAQQLSALTVYLGIKRQKKNLPRHTFKTTNDKLINLYSDGKMYQEKPSINVVEKDKNVKIDISARNIKEARNILKGLSKKYKNLDVEKMLSNHNETRKYLDGNLIFDNHFGGDEAGKSIIKTALSLIYDCGISYAHCEDAMEYIHDKGIPCFGYYYDSDLLNNRDDGIPINCVFVKGSKENHNILAYIEYYGIHRVVCRLSNNYSGKNFENIYALDPTTGKIIENLQVSRDIDSIDIDKLYNYDYCSTEKIRFVYSKIMGAAYKRSIMRESDYLTEKSIQDWYKENKINNDQQLTDEQALSLSTRIANDMMPMIIQNIRKNRSI